MITWPPIDAEVEAAVLRQLHTDVSIYDRSGVIARFEDAFAARHHARHALLTSSGTVALHSAYYALGVGPGDEVLAQDYTFFASAMPLFVLGASPVPVDVTPDGEIDLDAADALITTRTRALVITHMWGSPQDMRAVRAWCDAHDLALVEDCSHAHGAARAGVTVGELADAAAFSLQGKKTITGGEGGILLTPHRDVYDRAVLLGHFNKRALADVDGAHPLYGYAETGLGLKYRAHPLAVAMAEVYLRRLDHWLAARAEHAQVLAEAAADAGLHVLTPAGGDRTPALYAFVAAVPPTASYTRDDLLAAIRAAGCTDWADCESMMPLHTHQAFTAPISPVTRYAQPLIRADMSNATRLAATTIRTGVPADHSPDSEHHTRAAAAALRAAARALAPATVEA